MARLGKEKVGTISMVLYAIASIIMMFGFVGLITTFRNSSYSPNVNMISNSSSPSETNASFYYCGIAVSEQQYYGLNSAGYYQFEGNPCHSYGMNGTIGMFNITLDAGVDGPVTLYGGSLLVPLETPTYNYSPPSYFPDMGMMWGGLADVNATTGNVVWEDRFNYSIMTQPLAVNGIAYIGSGDDFSGLPKKDGIFAINITDGKIVWSRLTMGQNMPTFVYYNNSIIQVGSWVSRPNDIGQLQVFDPLNGSVKWQLNISAFSAMSSPVLVGNIIYFGADSYQSMNRSGGVVYAIDADSHKIVWKTHFPKNYNRATQDSTVSIWNNTLVDGYAITYNRTNQLPNMTINLTLAGIYLNNGTIRWTFNEGLGNNTPRSVLPATTAYDGISFSDTTEMGWLYALNMSTGKQIWRFYTGPSLPNPQVIDGYVFAENQTGTVFVLGLDGTLYKKINLGTPEGWCGSAEIFRIGDKLLFGGENGRLMAMPISDFIGPS